MDSPVALQQTSKSIEKAFDQLSDLDQHLLFAAALWCSSVSPSELWVLLELIWTPSAVTPFPKIKEITTMVGSLQSRNWLNRESYSRSTLTPAIADFLFQKMLIRGTLKQWAEKVDTRYASPYRGSRRADEAQVYIPLYLGNHEKFAEWRPRYSYRAAPLVPFEFPLPEAFAKMPADFQYSLIPRLIRDGIGRADGILGLMPEIDELLKNPDRVTESFLQALIDLAVANGSLQQLRDLHAQFGNEHPEIAGCEAFLTGDLDRALDLLTDAQKRYRKRTGKRNDSIPNFPTFFQIAILLKQNTAEALKQLEALLKTTRKEEKGSWFHYQELIPPLIEFQKSSDSKLNIKFYFSEHPPIEILLWAWITRWSFGESFGSNYKYGAELAELSRRFHDEKMEWLAREASALARGAAPSNEPVLEGFKVSPDIERLTTLENWLAPAPEWERSLNALQVLADQVSKSTPARGEEGPLAKERLIWEVKTDTKMTRLYLHPILQTRQSGAKGWTKGRPVALKRLYEGRNGTGLDYLTEHDRTLLSALRRYVNTYYYNEESFDWEQSKLAPAIVGHPLLFIEGDRETSLEIVQQQPQLIVSQSTGGQVQLQINPTVDQSDANFIVQKETTHRWLMFPINNHFRELLKILAKGMTVPSTRQEDVVNVVQKLSSTVTVHSEIAGAKSESVTANSVPNVWLSPMQQGLQVEFYVRPFGETGPLYRPGEGGEHVFAEVDGRHLTAHRDLAEERKQMAALIAECSMLQMFDSPEQHRFTFPEPDHALELVLQLQECGDKMPLATHWPKGGKLRVHSEISVSQFRIQVKKEKDWFAATGTLELDDNQSLELVQLMELLDHSPSRFVKLEDGQFIALTDQLRRRVEELSFYGERMKDRLRFSPIRVAAIEEFVEQTGAKTDKHWKEQVLRIQHAREFTPELPKMLQAELRDYQTEGYVWLRRLAEWGVGACLADDMGLGKTVQSIAMLIERGNDGPALVVAPTSVGFNWQNEIVRFAPSLRPKLFGTGDRDEFFANLEPRDVVICTYGLLHSEAERFEKVRWSAAILDEAQAIKNMATRRSQAAMKLQADFKMIMTGTPLENHLGELWNLFQFINPGLLGSWEQFQQQFASPIERTQCKLTRQRLKKLIQPFLLRRTKAQVLTELPARTEVTRLVEMSREEILFYEALRKKAIEKLNEEQESENAGAKHLRILAELTRLRRACCHSRLVTPELEISSSKLELFSETISEIIDNQHKVLVFSQFVDHLSILREELDRKGIRYQYLDGSTPQKERKNRVEAFQSGDGDVFLISLKAGGSGLNLTAADYVIHMDPWWNPAVEDQASDRAHRIGQQRPVTIYRFITRGTIEEKIVELHATKRNLADSLLEGTDTASKMTADELMKLIQE